jgi:hypothetical protein
VWLVLLWGNVCKEKTTFVHSLCVHILGFYICVVGLNIAKHYNVQGL